MTELEKRSAAQKFVDHWQGKGYEKGQSQPFWLSLLRDVYGVDKPEQIINFEDQVMLDHTSFIDGCIPTTNVLIEQKSMDKDLRKAIKPVLFIKTKLIPSDPLKIEDTGKS
jgi:hypothetical protein